MERKSKSVRMTIESRLKDRTRCNYVENPPGRSGSQRGGGGGTMRIAGYVMMTI